MSYTDEEFTKAESPVTTPDSGDDIFHWNQYKCEDQQQDAWFNDSIRN